MEYVTTTIYFALFILVFLILGYNFLYSQRVGGASQKLGIILPYPLRRFLDFVTIIAFVFLLIIGFFLILSIFETINKF